MKRTRSESLAKASKDLMLKEPFYGFFLMNLNKMWDEKIPTACVGLRNLNYQLRLNPKFWDELPGEHHPKGLLKHELMHIGFFHLQMISKLNYGQKFFIKILVHQGWI